MDVLKLIQIELDNVGNDMLEPPEDADKAAGEEPLGVAVSQDARVAYTVWQRLSLASMRTMLDAQAARSRAERERLKVVAHATASRASLVRDCFWYAVREEIGEWDGAIGVRSGWEVVRLKAEHPLAGLLRRLGAEGGAE